MNISPNAQKAYDFLKQHYIREGYCFSGSIPINSIMEVLATYDFKVISQVLDELEEAGIIQKSDSQAFSIELVKKERKDLILSYDLERVWKKEQAGSTVRLIGEDGEITKVLKA